MITYQEVPGAAALQVKVRLDKKIVGGIYKTPIGNYYYYRPTGKPCGDTFDTITEVKESIEGD